MVLHRLGHDRLCRLFTEACCPSCLGLCQGQCASPAHATHERAKSASQMDLLAHASVTGDAPVLHRRGLPAAGVRRPQTPLQRRFVAPRGMQHTERIYWKVGMLGACQERCCLRLQTWRGLHGHYNACSKNYMKRCCVTVPMAAAEAVGELCGLPAHAAPPAVPVVAHWSLNAGLVHWRVGRTGRGLQAGPSVRVRPTLLLSQLVLVLPRHADS